MKSVPFHKMISRVAVLLISSIFLQMALGGPDVYCGEIIIFGKNHYYSELEEKFGNCTIASKIHVFETNLYELDFLSNIRMINTSAIVVSYYAVHIPPLVIWKNHHLRWTEKTFASLSTIEASPDIKAALIAIYDNKKLCVSQERKEQLLQLTERSAQIQRCQCFVKRGSSIHGFYSKLSRHSDQCEEIHGDLKISDGPRGTPDPYYVEKFRNVRKIYGSLTINNSCWQNLSIFSKLEKVRTKTDIAPIQIINNAHLKNTFLPRLTRVKVNHKVPWLVIDNNPKFRYHPETIAQISRIESKVHRLPASMVQSAVCDFTEDVLTAANLPSLKGCTVIRGNLTINEESGFTHSGELRVLQNVIKLEGCLTISKTQLKDLKFLSNWQYLMCNADRMPIVIEYNFLLQSVDVSFEIRSNYTSTIRLTNNGCLRSGVVAYLEQLWERPVQFYEDDGPFIPCWSKPRFTNEILLFEIVVAVILLVLFYYLGGFLIRGALGRNTLDSTSHSTKDSMI